MGCCNLVAVEKATREQLSGLGTGQVGGGCPRCLQDLSCSMSHSCGTYVPSPTWRELRETWLRLCTGNIDDGLGLVKVLEYLVV